jgi:GTP-binding protein of the ras superfamily involved in termination of M-phase
MKAPLVFVSAKESINVNKLFKLIVGKIFDTDVGVEEILGDGEPLIKYSFSGKEEAD